VNHTALCSVLLLAVPVAALAEDDAAPDLETVLVTGTSAGYAALDSVTATKTDTPLIDVPQTIQVVTRQQLEDQAHHSIAEVLRYVPGTTVGQGEGNRDQITLRGQNTTADFFLDGVRDDVQYYRNLYNIERVEVLKGPYALIFGRGGGGGIINRVQKAPSSASAFLDTAASVNSFGAWDVAVDANTPVGDAAALRINAFHEKLANHRDAYAGDRQAVNPYFAQDFGNGWKAGLSYEYVKDDRVTDRGIPSLACVQPCTPGPLPGSRDRFFGVPGVNRAGVEAHIVKARLDASLAPTLDWSTTLVYGDYDKYYTNVYANGAATSTMGTVALAGYTDPTQRENLIAQTNLVWDATLGGMDHKVLFGLEYAKQDSTNQRRNAVLSRTTLDLANPAYPTVSFPALSRDTASQVEVLSAYVQDQVSVTDHVDVIVGLRSDRFDITGTDFMPAVDRPFSREDNKTSPRLGVVLKPRGNLSVYGSYSQSFLPRSGDQFLTLSATQQDLEPERFTNHEVGVKWDPAQGLSATLALFELRRTNATTPDPANPANTINVGATRTRGLELGLVGRLRDNWQVSGGYTHQDATLEGNDFVQLGQVPRQQFALWNRIDITGRVGAGLGITHQASQFAANRTSASVTRLPAFTRVDAAMYFKANARLQWQLNVENLLDTTYFADAHNNNNLTPGAPRNARLSVRWTL
jgi:catecholate siderophore receptor